MLYVVIHKDILSYEYENTYLVGVFDDIDLAKASVGGEWKDEFGTLTMIESSDRWSANYYEIRQIELNDKPQEPIEL